MAEYIRREDAKIILQRAWIEDPFRRQEAFDELNSIPSANVVEVVRCKDCEFGKKVIDNLYSCNDLVLCHAGSFYCANGKRREYA